MNNATKLILETPEEVVVKVVEALSIEEKLQRVVESNASCVNMMSNYHKFSAGMISEEDFKKINEICYEMYAISLTCPQDIFKKRGEELVAEYGAIMGAAMPKSKDELQKMN